MGSALILWRKRWADLQSINNYKHIEDEKTGWLDSNEIQPSFLFHIKYDIF